MLHSRQNHTSSGGYSKLPQSSESYIQDSDSDSAPASRFRFLRSAFLVAYFVFVLLILVYHWTRIYHHIRLDCIDLKADTSDRLLSEHQKSTLGLIHIGLLGFLFCWGIFLCVDRLQNLKCYKTLQERPSIIIYLLYDPFCYYTQKVYHVGSLIIDCMCTSGFCIDVTQPSIRWVILFLSCWLLFGNYYAFDNPSALNRQLMVWLGSDYDTYQYQLNLLYSVYSFPNVVLPLFAGNLMDRFGTHRLLLLFSLLVLLGQGMFALGVQWKAFVCMLTGRVIFGLGGESLTVAQARLVTEWFRGKELALAIGLNLSVARFGTVFNNNLSPWFADLVGIPFAVWIGFVSCLWSFICAVVTIIIDTKSKSRSNSQSQNTASNSNTITSNHSVEFETHSNNNANIRSTEPFSLWLLLKNTGPILATYHPAFWLVCIVCFTYYGALVPFNNIASDFLRNKWFGDDVFKTGLVMSIPDTVAIILVPIFGSFVDRYGHKLTLMTLGGVMMTCGHFLLGTTYLNPIVPLCMNGIANSTLMVLWPCIPLLVPEIYWASAYGIMTMCVNASYTFIPFGVAALTTMDPSYYSVEMYFMSLTFFGTFISVVLTRTDHQLKLGLNISERQTIMETNQWEEVPLSADRIAAPIKSHAIDLPSRRRTNSIGAELDLDKSLQPLESEHPLLTRFPGSQPPPNHGGLIDSGNLFLPKGPIPSYDPPLEPLIMLRHNHLYPSNRTWTSGTSPHQPRRATMSARQNVRFNPLDPLTTVSNSQDDNSARASNRRNPRAMTLTTSMIAPDSPANNNLYGRRSNIRSNPTIAQSNISGNDSTSPIDKPLDSQDNTRNSQDNTRNSQSITSAKVQSDQKNGDDNLV
jgi:MFS family permease